MLKRFFVFLICLTYAFSVMPITVNGTDVHTISTSSTTINAREFYTSTGSVANIDEYWNNNNQVDYGDYIWNTEGAAWSTSYKINVPIGNDGQYDVSVVCGHWINFAELKLYLDNELFATLTVPQNPAPQAPAVFAGAVEIDSGEHVIKVEGTTEYSGYFFKQFTLQKESVAPTLEGITPVNPEDEVLVGESKTLTYALTPADMEINDFVWESDNTDICTVDNGVITGVAEGEAVITLSTPTYPGITASWSITVSEPSDGEPYDGVPFTILNEGTSMLYAAKKNINTTGGGGIVLDYTAGSGTIETNPEAMAIRAGASGEFWKYTVDVKKAGKYKIEILGTSGWNSTAGTDAGGRFTMNAGNAAVAAGNEILPSFSNEKGFYQFTDDDKVNLGEFQLAEGVQVIKMTVTNSTSHNDVQFRKIWFTFIPTLSEIKQTETQLSAARGKTVTLEYELLPTGVAVNDLVWESSNPAVCTVSGGVVTAVAKGNATITLKSPSYPGITANWQVNVFASVDSISLNKTAVTLQVGQTDTLTATVFPQDADDKTVIWQSSNREVASVANGVVSANGAGTAVITANCGNISSGVTVTVENTGSTESGSGGSGGGGGQIYVPSGKNTQNTAENDNEIIISGSEVSAMEGAAMQKIFKNNDFIKYNIASDNFSASINGEFFTKNSGNKALVYAMNGVTAEIGADALNKANPTDKSKVSVNAELKNSVLKIDIKLDGKAVSDFNNAIKVKIPANMGVAYTVVSDGSEIKSEITEDSLEFAVPASGEYEIKSSKLTYKDADALDWAKNDIYTAMEKGVLAPVSREEFGADINITRGELVFAVVKALGLTGEIQTVFDDVTADEKYFNEISVAKSLNIINGVDGRNFSPNSFISRQDMAKVIFNAITVSGKIPEVSGGSFGDDAQIAGYAKEAVYKLAGSGILKGSDIGFEPLKNTTRAEIAVLLGRIYK